MDAGRASGRRISKHKTIADIVKLYREEVSKTKPFGRGKEWCLKRLEDPKLGLGKELVATLSVERIVHCITKQREVQGVTASIDLTYLGGVLKMTHHELAKLRNKSHRTVQYEMNSGVCPVPVWQDGATWLCNVSDVAARLDRERDAAIARRQTHAGRLRAIACDRTLRRWQ